MHTRLEETLFAPPALEIAVQIVEDEIEKTLEERKGPIILDGRHHRAVVETTNCKNGLIFLTFWSDCWATAS